MKDLTLIRELMISSLINMNLTTYENCDYNDKHRDIANNLGINGFPTIRYINKNRKSADYQGGTNVKDLLNFLIKNS